jgi:hypothetical protein
MLRKIMLGVLALTLGLLSAPASAGTLTAQPTAVTEGSRVVVTVKGKKPTKATLIVGGTRYPLKRKGKVWRTKPLSSEALAAMAGAKAKLKVKVKGKNKTLKTSIQGTSTTPPPTTPGGGTQPLFVAPGVDRVGNEAWDAVKGYFANSTLTDCPAGWPNCPVEQRFGFFDSGTTWYCRLTNNAGSDIRSQATITGIVGAEQKADGSWAVSYQDEAYGYNHFYTVRVAANGAGTVQYWASGADPNGPPSEVYSGLQWMRGAKDCSY